MDESDGGVRQYHRDVVDFLRDSFGNDLRGVMVSWSDSKFETPYIREDIREKYSEEELRRIGEEALYHAFEKPYHDEVYDTGDLRYWVESFEEAYVVTFSESEDRNTNFSVDSDTETDILEVADDCHSMLER